MRTSISLILRYFNKAIKQIFLRKHPWQIHFFYETMQYNNIFPVIKFLLTNNVQNGDYIQQFEKQFKDSIDSDGFVFGFGAGRMAFYSILEALDIKEGDEVIVPAFTCEVVIFALLYREIVPVYTDIDPYTYNIDVSKIEGMITNKTKAIIAQHSFGIPCEMDVLLKLAKMYDLFVIEDCALSQGSSYKGKPVGTIGHASFFSTDRTKVMSTQWGGIAFTADSQIAERIKRVYLQSPFLGKMKILNIGFQVLLSRLFLSPYTYFWGKYIFALGFKLKFFYINHEDKEFFTLPGDYPCRLSNFQSFLGLTQLNAIQENLKLRKDTVKSYLNTLRKNKIDLQYSQLSLDVITLRFVFMLKNRDSFIKKWEKYFNVGKWFDSPAVGWYENFEKIGYTPGSCTVAEKVHKHIINFPTHQTSPVIRKFLCNVLDSIQPDEILYPRGISQKRRSCHLNDRD